MLKTYSINSKQLLRKVHDKANTNIDKIKQGGHFDRPALFIIGK